MDPYVGAALIVLAASVPAYIVMTGWARVDARRQQDLNYRAALKAGNYEGGPKEQPDLVQGLVTTIITKVLENPENLNRILATFQGHKKE